MACDEEEEISDLTVLMRVLDIIERRIESRGLRNYETIQITRVANQFLPGSKIGRIVQGSDNEGGGDVVMGDKFEAHGQARVGNMGNKAKINHISFGDSGDVPEGLDLVALVEELKVLRTEMRSQASLTEEDAAIVAVGQAISAAENGDTSGVGKHLRDAGNWALGLATAIGGGVAAGAIKTALGL